MSLPAWHPESLAARLPFLRRRAMLTAATRAFFTARGYTEVETPYAVRTPGEEVHLRAFRTEREHPDGSRETLWLHTSPEFAMKKLLAGGAGPIFQFARVWRNGEGSDLHAPEFTMLEWYRPGADMDSLIAETADYLRAVLSPRRQDKPDAEKAAPPPLEGGGWGEGSIGAYPRPTPPPKPLPQGEGEHSLHLSGASPDAYAVLPPVVTCRGVTTDLSRYERLTMVDAFARHVGADLLATAGDAAALATAAGTRLRDSETWEDCFFRMLLERVEPLLGRAHPTFLTHWPVAQAALARRDPTDPRVAERFELFVCGIELANAFVELTDPVEQRARFTEDRARRHAIGGKDWELDEDFLAALAHGMPPAAGIALGFDRLAMIVAGADRIDQVLWI